MGAGSWNVDFGHGGSVPQLIPFGGGSDDSDAHLVYHGIWEQLLLLQKAVRLQACEEDLLEDLKGLLGAPGKSIALFG